MPKEFDDCVASMSKTNGKDSAYAICVAQYKKKHGKSPFSKKEEISTLPISRGARRLLEAQFEGEKSGKTVKIVEETTGDVVKIAETKT